MSAPGTPLVAVTLDARWVAAAPADIGRAAQTLDEAGVDLLILGGAAPGLHDFGLDPLVLAAWLARRVKHAGLVTSVPALHALPFHVARALSALDILTLGRAGWAPTTLGHAKQAAAVGPDARARDMDALAKAADFVGATTALWDSWDAEALIIDKASGVYLDPAHVRRVHYRGPWFQVMGPLNAARPPQGHPVLVQSDADPLWRAMAARADALLVEAPDAATLTARREVVAEASGSARLFATLGVAESRDGARGVGPWLDLFAAGLVDGVHFTTPDHQAVEALVEVLMPELRGPNRRQTDPEPGSLRARLGLADHANSGPAHRFASPAEA